jgi:hypothetical protein
VLFSVCAQSVRHNRVTELRILGGRVSKVFSVGAGLLLGRGALHQQEVQERDREERCGYTGATRRIQSVHTKRMARACARHRLLTSKLLHFFNVL